MIEYAPWSLSKALGIPTHQLQRVMARHVLFQEPLPEVPPSESYKLLDWDEFINNYLRADTMNAIATAELVSVLKDKPLL